MITIAHLLDDFSMGGVTRALTLFDEPMIKARAQSRVIPIDPASALAPRIDADLIVDHTALSWRRFAFLASLRARHPNARIVHVMHGYTRAFEACEVKEKRRFRRMLRSAARLVDDIICVSDAQRDWLMSEVGIGRDRLRVIYPWTDRTELFSLPAAPARDGRALHLLAYGRYAEVKNFAELITAMRSFRPSEVRLTVFGDGPQRTLLTALAADMPHVEVLGPSSSPAVHLASCDAVIVPSRYEPFGLVATEARMAGRAVIAADIDGLPEQVREGGQVAALGSAYDIAQAIRAATRADLAQLGMEGRRGVKSQHTQILRRWCQLIEHVDTARNPHGVERAMFTQLERAQA
ncbi:MAG: glycosyltransferase family 4 protein [Pseudomonadota bacterium]